MTSSINFLMFFSKKKENNLTILVTLKSVSDIYQLRFLSPDFGCFNVKSAKQLQFNLKNLKSKPELPVQQAHAALAVSLYLIIVFVHEQKETDKNDTIERSFEHYKITLDNKNPAAFFIYSQYFSPMDSCDI